MIITNAKKKSKVIPILSKRTSAGVRSEDVLLFSPAAISANIEAVMTIATDKGWVI